MVFAEGLCFYKLFLVFMAGGVIGDLIETVYCYIKSKTWMSRSSFVIAHISIVWGFAMVIATIVFYRVSNVGSVYIFFAGVILGGIYEFACAVISEKILGVKFWDYSQFRFQLAGKINLRYCLFWGIASE